MQGVLEGSAYHTQYPLQLVSQNSGAEARASQPWTSAVCNTAMQWQEQDCATSVVPTPATPKDAVDPACGQIQPVNQPCTINHPMGARLI